MPDTEQQQAQELYDKLKVEAQVVYIDHIVSRTPPQLQDEMKAIAQADMGGGEPDPTVASVANGASVVVKDTAGTANPASPGTAVVAGGTLTEVTLAVLPPLTREGQGNVRTGTINPRR